MKNDNENKKIMYHEMTKIYNENDSNVDFLASTSWLRNFMKHNGLSLRKRASISKKDADKLVDKLVSFVLHVRRLSLKDHHQESNVIAMDETPIWSDMVTDKTVDTGTTTVTVKSLVLKNLEFLCALLQKQMVQSCLL